MPFYHKLGKIPHKRHTTFKKENGEFHYEELFGTIGFDGMASLLYHLHRPTQINKIGNYEANINLHAEVQAKIHIEVVKVEETK